MLLYLYLFIYSTVGRECANNIANYDATYCNVRKANVYRTRIIRFIGQNKIRLIHRTIDGQHRHVLLPMTLCYCHDRFNRGLPQTNNAVEGWHSTCQSNVGL